MNKQNIENAIAYWKEFKEEIPELKESYPETEQMLDEQEVFVATAIYCMEQQLTNGWIPVSSGKFPEIPKDKLDEGYNRVAVLVTSEYEDMSVVRWYDIEEKVFYDDWDCLATEDKYVTAWQPLPLKYKEDVDGED